jgi:hypothetical protein
MVDKVSGNQTHQKSMALKRGSYSWEPLVRHSFLPTGLTNMMCPHWRCERWIPIPVSTGLCYHHLGAQGSNAHKQETHLCTLGCKVWKTISSVYKSKWKSCSILESKALWIISSGMISLGTHRTGKCPSSCNLWCNTVGKPNTRSVLFRTMLNFTLVWQCVTKSWVCRVDWSSSLSFSSWACGHEQFPL